MRKLTRRTRAKTDYLVYIGALPTADVPPPAAYPDAKYLVFPSRGTALGTKALANENLLHTTIRAGMDTRLAGFARWTERGDKPEFLGLSRLCTSSEAPTRRRLIPPLLCISEPRQPGMPAPKCQSPEQ